MRFTHALVPFVIAALAIAGCDDSTDVDNEVFQAELTAAAQIPRPNLAPTATAIANIALDNDNTLFVEITIAGQLTSNLTMAHIHGPANVSEVNEVVLDFTPTMTAMVDAGTRTGRILNAPFDLESPQLRSLGVLRVLPTDLITMLRNGTAYVDIHTVANPLGEIRGQVIQQ